MLILLPRTPSTEGPLTVHTVLYLSGNWGFALVATTHIISP